VTRHVNGAELFLSWRKNDHDARGTRWLPKGAPSYVRQGARSLNRRHGDNKARRSGGYGACRQPEFGRAQGESR
jgi:hypothetical protein